MIHTAKRTCWIAGYHHPHAWEVLNPMTYRPFRRGRIVFYCITKSERPH